MRNKHLLTAFLLSASLGGFAQKNVDAPKPCYPIPTKHQVDWQKMENYAFIHFGPNTFNDKEWGYGDASPSTFNPTQLNTDQWAATIAKAGLKGIILTAKHHDGFCLWPTKYTDYSILNSPYKDGKGDIVGELAASCKKYGLKFGVYLSPWDRHQAFYGTPLYVEYFYHQLHELFTKYGDIFEIWFDGANGGDGWYGGTKEKRKIDGNTYYHFDRAHKMITELQPQAIAFSDDGPGCRWVGNEKGFADATNWSFLKKGQQLTGQQKRQVLHQGNPNGDIWVPAECDVSIRPGWFYHAREDNKVKSVDQLVDIYYRSVGHNANFLINFPVDKRGLIHATDSAHAVQMHQRIMRELGNNLMTKAKITATSTRGKNYAVNALTDHNYDTYWATPDSVLSASLNVYFKQPTRLNRLLLQEYIPLGQRVKKFRVEYKDGKTWKALPVKEETTTIGYKRILRFPTITTKQLRIEFTDARACLCISEIGGYYAPQANDNFVQKAQDLKGYKYTQTSQAPNVFLFDLGKNEIVRSLHYLPASDGLISHYEVLVGEDPAHLKSVASGEFSNIKNNPIMQEVYFTPVIARYVMLKAVHTVDDHPAKVKNIILR